MGRWGLLPPFVAVSPNGIFVVQATAGAPRTVLKGPDGSRVPVDPVDVEGLPGLGGFNLTQFEKKYSMPKSNWSMKPQG